MPVDALLGIPDMSNFNESKYEVNFKESFYKPQEYL
jgi:hypothetical protein